MKVIRRSDHLLCSGASPIIRSRNRKLCPVFNTGGDQHGFVSGKNGLAKGNVPLGLVLASHIPRAIDAIRFVGERFLDLSILIAIQASVLGGGKRLVLSDGRADHGRGRDVPWTADTCTRSHPDPIAPSPGRAGMHMGNIHRVRSIDPDSSPILHSDPRASQQSGLRR